jgi:hypothetical protein
MYRYSQPGLITFHRLVVFPWYDPSTLRDFESAAAVRGFSILLRICTRENQGPIFGHNQSSSKKEGNTQLFPDMFAVKWAHREWPIAKLEAFAMQCEARMRRADNAACDRSALVRLGIWLGYWAKQVNGVPRYGLKCARHSKRIQQKCRTICQQRRKTSHAGHRSAEAEITLTCKTATLARGNHARRTRMPSFDAGQKPFQKTFLI